MVALIQISDIEAALGRPADDAAEETKWQFYIDSLSDYICNFVDVSFEKITETVRLKADGYGIINLPGGPIHSITDVVNFRTGMSDQYVDWDGISVLYYLEGGQTVDVTYTHGYDIIPKDIRNLALNAILGMLNEGDPAELRSLQVGDVREEYRDSFFQALLGEVGMVTLYKYCDTNFTINASGLDMNMDYEGRGFIND